MCSIFIQGSQNISCSSPSILIILTHQQTKLDSRIQLQKKRSITLKLCVPFSHSDVNHSTFSFQNENSSFQMIKIGACVYLKIKPKSTKEKRELQLMCCLSFQTSFLCIYTPIVVFILKTSKYESNGGSLITESEIRPKPPDFKHLLSEEVTNFSYLGLHLVIK